MHTHHSTITNCNFDHTSQLSPQLKVHHTLFAMINEQTSLADLAGIQNAETTFHLRQTPSPLSRSSNSVASFVGSCIRRHDVADEKKWLELKTSIRTFCQGLGKIYCQRHFKSAHHDCTDSPFCPILGEMNFACLVGAALNDGRYYRPCVTLAPSKNCTTKQKKATKQILRSNVSELVEYVNVISKDIFKNSMQIDTVISQD